MKTLSKRIQALMAVAILVIASLATLGIDNKAYAYTFPICTWTGDGGDNNFSNAANWSGCGGHPVSGTGNISSGTYERLIFDNSSLTQNEVLNNDLGSLVIHAVEFTGTNPTYSIRIGGDPIVGGPGADSINDGTTATNASGFDDTLDFGLNSVDISINNPNGTYFANIEGGEATLVSGSGLMQVADLSQKTGVMAFIQPELELMPTGDMTVNSVIINGLSGLILDNQGPNDSTYTYNLLVNFSDWEDSNSQILLPGDAGTNDQSILAGNIELDNDVSVVANGGNTLDITAPITDDGYNISSVASNDTSVSILPGDNSQSASNPTIGENVTYYVDGLLGDVTVGEGGLLKGDGTVASADIESGGGIAPGHSPGCLTVSGNFTLAGTYTADIQSPGETACTDYDQTLVGGTIDLSGGDLDVNFLGDFTPSVGQSFEIINNTGGTPITGTFNGLPEGAVFAVGNTKMQITYVGAGGNNVVLTVVSVGTPATAIVGTPDTGYGMPNSVTPYSYLILAVGTFITLIGLENLARLKRS